MKFNQNSIYQINQTDQKGGAARIAWLLHKTYQSLGMNTKLFVKQKMSSNGDVIKIPENDYRNPLQRKLIRFSENLSESKIDLQKLSLVPKYLARPELILSNILGFEEFDHPSTKQISLLSPSPPCIIHAHNLHINYFDLRQLPFISHQYPFLITLHDTWLFTGHCAYFINCQRWKGGCGKCPDLNRYPSIRKDATRYNWKRKNKIYQNSQLFIASPSKWLLDQASESMLSKAIKKKRVISNGVDHSIFKPSPAKEYSRMILDLPKNNIILLYVTANNTFNNPYKDYTMISDCIKILCGFEIKQPITFVCLGKDAPNEALSENIDIKYYPFIKSQKEIALFYQAADIFLHSAFADNFPNTILESLSCGVPVIATNVGGISEQIKNHETGFLISQGDSVEMAKQIHTLINDREMLVDISNAASVYAKRYFSHIRMVKEYLNYYEEIIDYFNEQ